MIIGFIEAQRSIREFIGANQRIGHEEKYQGGTPESKAFGAAGD
jgi:hypothetical protein